MNQILSEIIVCSSDSDLSQKSDLHYAVKSKDGRKDIYSKPSLKLKLPPDLPPRNSPRQSWFETKQSPDYQEMEDEDAIESLESFQLNVTSKKCQHCKDPLQNNSRMINSNGSLYHTKCFVCAQCFQPFKVKSSKC